MHAARMLRTLFFARDKHSQWHLRSLAPNCFSEQSLLLSPAGCYSTGCQKACPKNGAKFLRSRAAAEHTLNSSSFDGMVWKGVG